MGLSKHSGFNSRSLRIAAYIIFTGAIGLFCLFYLTHSQAYLATWFRGLKPCFYRNTTWETGFFNPAVKAHGNIICWAGLAAIAAIFTLKAIGKRFHQAAYTTVLPAIKPVDLACLALLLAAGCYGWSWAHHHILPYNDEVFSAVHCAELHPIQTAAYYMLPNNHIGFNLINSFLLRLGGDSLLTARLLSGSCFLALLVLLYFWCRQLMGYRMLAVLTPIAIAIHFQTWGFAAMGRGYGMCLLCEWASFIFLWQYLRTHNHSWLRLLTVAVVAGFVTLPTFLYFFAALAVAALGAQLYRRKPDAALLRYGLLSLLLTFLCHIPALSFSGLHAFLANDYVQAGSMPYSQYFPDLIVKMHEALLYCFTGYFTVDEDMYLLLAGVPLLSLLWLRRKRNLFFGLFFAGMWGTLLLISWKMRQTPYLRNLNGHMSITYAFILITAFWGMQELSRRLKLRKAILVVFPLFLGLFFYHYIKLANERLARALYHFDINRYAELLRMDLRDLPPHATVSFSDESFYLMYISREMGFGVVRCGEGGEDFYIKTDPEAMPSGYASYRKMWQRGDYFIYRHPALKDDGKVHE